MTPQPRLVPITGKAALRFIADVHRHLPRLQGALWAVALEDGGQIVGVGTAGNPPYVWQGTGRFVISRVATKDGDGWHEGPHAAPYCSMIYGALSRAGKALGYREAWTYTLLDEPGTSLRAAGFKDMGLTDGGEWDRPSRARAAAVRPEPKRRWMRQLASVGRNAEGHDRATGHGRNDEHAVPSETSADARTSPSETTQ